MRELERQLRVLVEIGRHTIDNPVTAAKIGELLDVHPREVSQIVSAAVQVGIPIVSCGRGYFRFRSLAERQVYLDQERSRLVSLGQKLAAIKRATSDASPSLFDDDGTHIGEDAANAASGYSHSSASEAT